MIIWVPLFLGLTAVVFTFYLIFFLWCTFIQLHSSRDIVLCWGSKLLLGYDYLRLYNCLCTVPWALPAEPGLTEAAGGRAPVGQPQQRDLPRREHPAPALQPRPPTAAERPHSLCPQDQVIKFGRITTHDFLKIQHYQEAYSRNVKVLQQ